MAGIPPSMIQAGMAAGQTAMTNPLGSMGDWLLQLLPDFMASQGLEPPTSPQEAVDQAPLQAAQSATEGQVAQAQPNPVAAVSPDARMPVPYDPQIASVPQVNSPAGMTFNGAPNQVKEISPQEKAAIENSSNDNSVGAALSGIKAMQPNGAPYPNAPGVSGTRAVDANLLQVIQALTRQNSPSVLGQKLR